MKHSAVWRVNKEGNNLSRVNFCMEGKALTFARKKVFK